MQVRLYETLHRLTFDTSSHTLLLFKCHIKTHLFMAVHSNGQAIIFSSCAFYLLVLVLVLVLLFSPRLFSAVANWKFTIL